MDTGPNISLLLTTYPINDPCEWMTYLFGNLIWLMNSKVAEYFNLHWCNLNYQYKQPSKKTETFLPAKILSLLTNILKGGGQEQTIPAAPMKNQQVEFSQLRNWQLCLFFYLEKVFILIMERPVPSIDLQRLQRTRGSGRIDLLLTIAGKFYLLHSFFKIQECM